MLTQPPDQAFAMVRRRFRLFADGRTMSGFYTTFLGLGSMDAGTRTDAEQRADELMDSGASMADVAAAYAALPERTGATVVRHALCLAWSGQASGAIAMIEAAGLDSLPARSVLAEAWFARAGDEAHPERGTAMTTGWAVLLPVLEAGTPPWLAFAILEQRRWENDELDRAVVDQQLARAARLYPDDERFPLAVDHAYPRDATASRLEVLSAAMARVPSARLATRLAFVHSANGNESGAATCFQTAETMEATASGDAVTISQLRLLRVEQLLRHGDGQAALALASTVGDIGRDRLSGPRARLAAACLMQDASLIATHGHALIDAFEISPHATEAEVLRDEVMFIEGPGWTDREVSSDLPDLHACRTTLLASEDARVRGWMQYLFAEHDYRSEENESDGEDAVETDWAALSTTLKDAAQVTASPRVALFDASVRLRLKKSNWREVGRDWVRARVAVEEAGVIDAAPAIEALLTKNIPRARTFLRGVAEGLRAVAPAPATFDALDEALGDVRLHPDLAYEMAVVLQLVGVQDLRAQPQFALGYALALKGDAQGALQAYARVLEAEPGDVSAIFNSLLLCKTPAQADVVRQLSGLVDALDDEATTCEWRGKLAVALERAMKACAPADVPGSPMALMLADFPKLRADVPAPETLSLRGVIALIALARAAPPDGDLLLLRPLPMGTTLFSPTRATWHLLFDALRTGLVTVGGPTPADAVAATGDQWTIFPERIWWRLSPAAFAFIEEARSLGSVDAWPEAWQRLAPGLARLIAADECMQYVEYLCEQRRWPMPSGKEKLQTLLNDIIAQFSVSQAYYLFYISVMAASDRKEAQGLTGQHASNLLVVIAADRFERAKAGRYGEAPPTSWRRHTYPRSALSLALWSDLLDMGDMGFERPVGDALGMAQPG
ncbi:hypothetical protein P3W24_06660 [Luteibacter sp. PPL201]|uniref:Tetratricopeptide repeat protein n=1 Tax=Luteibacter sahnii TaxID=3021977 RepID=A0ABT6B947_9GAMM